MAKTYIPECLVPHNPETGQLIRHNPFDNRHFAADGDKREGQKKVIITEQPEIPHVLAAVTRLFERREEIRWQLNALRLDVYLVE